MPCQNHFEIVGTSLCAAVRGLTERATRGCAEVPLGAISFFLAFHSQNFVCNIAPRKGTAWARTPEVRFKFDYRVASIIIDLCEEIATGLE